MVPFHLSYSLDSSPWLAQQTMNIHPSDRKHPIVIALNKYLNDLFSQTLAAKLYTNIERLKPALSKGYEKMVCSKPAPSQ